MNDSEMDKLFERAFSGPGPSDALRRQVLRDSTAVLAQRPRRRRHWRAAGLMAAGILIAATSFFFGRISTPSPAVEKTVAGHGPTESPETVVVSADLVEWLKAARLFEQLGMDQRVTRAYKHAAQLVPSQMYSIDPHSNTVLVARPDESTERPCEPKYRDIQSILAQSLGD